jgi:hypothetical protein
MIGGPALSTHQKREPSGPPFVATSANNGLSVDPVTGRIVLGNNVGGVLATLLSAREIPFNSFALSFTGTPTLNIGTTANLAGSMLKIERGATTRIGIEVGQSFTDAQMELIRIQAPNIETTSANYSWYQSNNTNTNLSHNQVMKWGYNVDRIEKSGQPGIWYAQEFHFESGGAIFLENHLEFSHPTGTNSRLFSSTLQMNAVFANVTNQWDLRGNFIVFSSVQGGSIAAWSRNMATGEVQQQLSGVTPVLQFSDTTSATVKQIQHTGSALLFSDATPGFALPVEMIVDPVGSYALGIRTPSTTRFALISFIRLGGQQYQMGVAGPTAGGGQANEFFWYDAQNNKVPLRFLPNGNVLVNNNYAVADDTAAFQVNGEISTIDPGAGRGRWKLGIVVAGAVAVDAANFVQIQINGAIVKLIKAV